MKRCPECRRDYADDTLLYCLEDGTALVQGSVPLPDEPQTAILSEPPALAGGQFTGESATAILSEPPAIAGGSTCTTDDAELKTAILQPPATAGGSDSTTRAAQPRERVGSRQRMLAGVGVVALVLVSGFFAYKYLAPTKQIESIAVMPFVNESGNTDLEYLSDGMTETLINSLSQIPNLRVKARSLVFRYKGKEIRPKELAAELGVQAILTGRILQRGDQLTLSLELIDGQTENTIWGNKYQRKGSDLVVLQSDVARDVSGELRSKLSGADAAKVEKTYTADPEAYQLYLKGRYYWNRRTTESLKQAADLFNQAIAKDPNYALAYSGLAESYALFTAYSVSSPKESFPLAKAAALQALKLDDSLAATHAALGMYLAQYEWDWAGSEKEYRRAIEIDPDYATAYQWLATDVFVAEKRFDEALAELRRAEALDPLSPIIGTNLGDVLVYSRRYDEAIVQYKRVLTRDPDFAYAHLALGWAYGSKGMYPEAIAETRESFELNRDPQATGYLGLWLARSGERGEVNKLLDQLKQEASERYFPGYTIAIIYAGLNENEEALDWLEKDFKERSFVTAVATGFMGFSPEFDGLRAEPRFKAMMKQVNLPE